MALLNQKFPAALRHFLKSGVLIIMACLSFSLPLNLQAQTTGQGLNITNSAIDFLDATAQEAKVKTNSQPTVAQIIGGVINIGLGIIGLFFFALTIYGGVTWLTAGGNKEKADKAVKILSNASLGVIIIIVAYLVTNFIIFRLINILAPA